MMKLPLVLLCGMLPLVLPVPAAINIVLDYGATSQADIDAYGAEFSAAEAFWESRLTGYRDSGIAAPGQMVIKVELGNIDGPSGILGQAGPTFGNFLGNFVEATQGEMKFDTSDLPSLVQNGTFETVIRHEMGHVLGFGSLWTYNGVYQNGTGQYTGAAGLAAFQEEFNQPNATYVPVELDGGPGTEDGHWNMGINLGVHERADSRDDPGDSIIYTSVNNGEYLFNELMSGFLTGSAWLSNTTLQSLYDIGFTVVPEPAAYALCLSLACLFRGVIRRKRDA